MGRRRRRVFHDGRAGVGDGRLRAGAARVGPTAGLLGAAGVDWGYSRDASTIVVLAVHADATAQRRDAMPVYFVPWLLAEHGMEYEDFVGQAVQVAAGYQVAGIASEVTGVGMAPTQLLTRALERDRRCAVTVLVPTHTTARLKEDAFGLLKLLVQQGRLLLPRHPELLKQLSNLVLEVSESGSVRIAVPDRLGHDDLAMGLCLAATFLDRLEGVTLPQDLLPEWTDEDEWALREQTRIGPDV